MMIRIGQGFDVHAFVPGDHLMLGGERIAHTHGVAAHSDGDVAIHALCDALLGALALGDIGQHFPPDDSRCKDADSRHFLEVVMAMVEAHGFALSNADITVICEQPKIAPHAKAMRTNLAHHLGVDIACISIKATTTERLGLTGRGEGIAAMAVVLLHQRSATMPCE